MPDYTKYPRAVPFIHTDPEKPFKPQVKDAVVIPEVKIERDDKDSRPPLVFPALYLEASVEIDKKKLKGIIGDPPESY